MSTRLSKAKKGALPKRVATAAQRSHTKPSLHDELAGRIYAGTISLDDDYEVTRGTKHCGYLFAMDDCWWGPNRKRFIAWLRYVDGDQSRQPDASAEQSMSQVSRVVREENLKNTSSWVADPAMRRAKQEVRGIRDDAPEEIQKTLQSAEYAFTRRLSQEHLSGRYKREAPAWIKEYRAPTWAEMLEFVRRGLGSLVIGDLSTEYRKAVRDRRRNEVSLDASSESAGGASSGRTMHETHSDPSAQSESDDDDCVGESGRPEPGMDLQERAMAFSAAAFDRFVAALPSRSGAGAETLAQLRRAHQTLTSGERTVAIASSAFDAVGQRIFDSVTRHGYKFNPEVYKRVLSEATRPMTESEQVSFRYNFDQRNRRLRIAWWRYLLDDEIGAVGAAFADASLDALDIMLGAKRYREFVMKEARKPDDLARRLAGGEDGLRREIEQVVIDEMKYRTVEELPAGRAIGSTKDISPPSLPVAFVCGSRNKLSRGPQPRSLPDCVDSWMGPRAINNMLDWSRAHIDVMRASNKGGILLLQHGPGMEVTAHTVLTFLSMALHETEPAPMVHAFAPSAEAEIPDEILALAEHPAGNVLLISALPRLPAVMQHLERALSNGLVMVATGLESEWSRLRAEPGSVLKNVDVKETVLTRTVADSVPQALPGLRKRVEQAVEHAASGDTTRMSRLEKNLADAKREETRRLAELSSQAEQAFEDALGAQRTEKACIPALASRAARLSASQEFHVEKVYDRIRLFDALGTPILESLLLKATTLALAPKELERIIALLCEKPDDGSRPLVRRHNLTAPRGEDAIVLTTAGGLLARGSFRAKVQARALKESGSPSASFITARDKSMAEALAEVAESVQSADYQDFQERNNILRVLSSVSVSDRLPYAEDDQPYEGTIPADWLDEMLRNDGEFRAGKGDDGFEAKVPRFIGIAERVLASNAAPWERLAWAMVMERFGHAWVAEELLEPLKGTYEPARVWLARNAAARGTPSPSIEE